MVKKFLLNQLEQMVKRAQGLELDAKLDEIKQLLYDKNLSVKKEEPKKTNPALIVFAVIGAIATVAAIAGAVYYFLIPEDSEDFEDLDFDDFEDFDDDVDGDD